MHTHRTPFWGLVQDAESGPKSPGSHDCGLSLPCATEMYGAMARPCLKSCSAFPWLLEEYPNSSLCLTETCTGVAPVPLSGLFRDHLAHARGPATLAILLLPEHVLTPTLLRLLPSSSSLRGQPSQCCIPTSPSPVGFNEYSLRRSLGSMLQHSSCPPPGSCLNTSLGAPCYLLPPPTPAPYHHAFLGRAA